MITAVIIEVVYMEDNYLSCEKNKWQKSYYLDTEIQPSLISEITNRILQALRVKIDIGAFYFKALFYLYLQKNWKHRCGKDHDVEGVKLQEIKHRVYM